MEQEIKRGPGRPPKYHETVAQAPVELASSANPVVAEASTVATRPNRKPFGALEAKLNDVERPGFHRHWFNDTPGRIARAIEAGYSHVLDKDGKNMCRIVGTAEGGGAMMAYRMEVPEEWWKADLAAQQEEVNEKEDTMRRGAFESQQGDGRYVPKQGIKISHGR